MQTNNELYKEICENYGITIESGVHTNNYYLHRIAEEVCQKTYSELECNGKYLKDIAEKLADTTYSGHHFNNFYLKEICTSITHQTYPTKPDNFYLEEWAINALNREESKLVWIVPPSNMEYGDFNASGVLTDKNDSSVKISGATVNLVIGSTVVDTGVTDSNGVVTFEGSPVHTGTHSFKLVFNGNQSYESSESSVVTITVSKETTYLNVEEYDSTGYSDGTVYITGQLLDNDSPQHSVTGETVKIIDKSDDTVLGTAITDNQGYFDCDLELSASNYAIRVIYEGTDDYNSSYEDISIEVIDPYLEVIVDKPVLSYADNDFTALSAVVHSGASVGDIRVDFSISDAQFTTYGITDSHGNCTALDSYQSLGLGDIELVATATVGGQVLTKTFVVEDCLDCYTTSTDFPRYAWGSNWYYLSPNEVPSECKVHMKFDNIVDNYQVGLGSSSGNFFAIQPYNNKTRVYRSGGVTDENVNLPSTSTDICFEILSSTSGKLYFDDTLIGTYTLDSSINRYLKVIDYANKAYDLTYIKIKPL